MKKHLADKSKGGRRASFVGKAESHDILHGYLKKKNRKGKWQRRYFRLTDEFLSYYASESDKRVKASIALKDCHEVVQKEREIHVVRNDTTYAAYVLLVSEGDISVEDWVSAIKKRLEVAPEPSEPAAPAAAPAPTGETPARGNEAQQDTNRLIDEGIAKSDSQGDASAAGDSIREEAGVKEPLEETKSEEQPAVKSSGDCCAII